MRRSSRRSAARPRLPLLIRSRPAGGPRDYQRARLYRWEAEHVLPKAAQLLELEACRRLVDSVYRCAEGWRACLPGWRPPEVTDGRGRRHACGSRQMIKLPRWARSVPIVLHECAHGLADDKHGPRFVAVYVDLLVAFAGFDRALLVETLRTARVDRDPAFSLRLGVAG